jgi:glucose/arabinose dehydrogenase
MRKNWLRYTLLTIVAGVAIVGAGGYVLLNRLPMNTAFAQGSGTLADITLPDGFEIAYYAQNVPGARTLRLSDNGTLYVGTRGAGVVYAIPNAASTTEASTVMTIANGLNNPNGIEVVNGDLYVAEIGRVLRYDDIEANLNTPPQPVVITDDLPTEAHHGWRYMAQGPDGMLYIAIGAPCNVCELQDFFGSISRMNPDGTGLEVFATGVRNSVGFDWHPETGNLWFTNNGRDWMGDDLPPDTLHTAAEPGLHFGFPYCHGGSIPDPDFGNRRDCSEFVRANADLTPHGAALGMRFYTGDMFPAEYTHQIFIAERGSWNRTVPIGYRVNIARLDGAGNVIAYEPFAEGWLNDSTGQAWGRPVDVQVMPDGALLVSDDTANAIYRIRYTG